MTIILPSLPDPTDLVIAGQQLRIPDDGFEWSNYWSPLIRDTIDRLPNVAFSQVTLPYETGMMEISTRRFSPWIPDQFVGRGIRANAGISTPCGALIPVLLGHQWFANDVGQSTVSFFLVGQTVTGAGAALGNCRVVVYETGRIAVFSTPARQFYSAGNPSEIEWESPSPVVAEGISDGSGNFSIPVPMNTAYQLTGYLAGSPDRTGITRQDVVPTTASILVYMRDPTAADSGGGGGLSARVIGSAVVRRIGP